MLENQMKINVSSQLEKITGIYSREYKILEITLKFKFKLSITMEKEEFLNLTVKSLEAVEKNYRNASGWKAYERILCYEFYHQFRRLLDKKRYLNFFGENLIREIPV